MNLPLKIAILKTGKRQQDFARLARVEETRLSKIMHNERRANRHEQTRIAALILALGDAAALAALEAELFPQATDEATPDSEAAA